jgi:hypothetical protein
MFPNGQCGKYLVPSMALLEVVEILRGGA